MTAGHRLGDPLGAKLADATAWGFLPHTFALRLLRKISDAPKLLSPCTAATQADEPAAPGQSAKHFREHAIVGGKPPNIAGCRHRVSPRRWKSSMVSCGRQAIGGGLFGALALMRERASGRAR
jgi:hypothetical protein